MSDAALRSNADVVGKVAGDLLGRRLEHAVLLNRDRVRGMCKAIGTRAPDDIEYVPKVLLESLAHVLSDLLRAKFDPRIAIEIDARMKTSEFGERHTPLSLVSVCGRLDRYDAGPQLFHFRYEVVDAVDHEVFVTGTLTLACSVSEM